MDTQTATLLTQYRELSERIEALTKERDAIAGALVALCPAQPGLICGDYRNVPMFVEKVTFRDDPAEWVLVGKRVKKNGVPHATASAYSWIRVEE